MKKHLTELRSAVMVTLMFAAVCCGLYPLVVFGISQALFRDQANGSLIVDAGGVVRGSRLIGQPLLVGGIAASVTLATICALFMAFSRPKPTSVALETESSATADPRPAKAVAKPDQYPAATGSPS